MSGTVNLAIIGNNFGAKVHYPAFQFIDHVAIKGIYSRNWQEAINDPKIDAVSIAVPPMIAFNVIQSAIENKKHIFCEKPGVANWKQALSLKKLLHDQLIHVIDFEMNECPIIKRAKRMLDYQELGNINGFECTWNSSTANNRNGWKTDIYQGGGALNNFGSHIFYLLEQLFGVISGFSDVYFLPSIENNTIIDVRVKFPKFYGHISINTDANVPSDFALTINCERGDLTLTNHSHNMNNFMLKQRLINQPSSIIEYINNNDQDGRINLVSSLAKRFIYGMQSGNQVSPNLYDGFRIQQINDILLRQVGNQ
jgi:predicted dehydrogenase